MPDQFRGDLQASVRPCRSDGAAPRPRAAHQRADHHHHEHSSDHGGHYRRAIERALDGIGPEQCAREKAADDRTDNAKDDVPHDPETFVALTRNPARYPAIAPSTIHATMLISTSTTIDRRLEQPRSAVFPECSTGPLSSRGAPAGHDETCQNHNKRLTAG